MNGMADHVMKLANRIKPLLRGNLPEVQSGVLGELISVFLSGHLILDEKGEVDLVKTAMLRREIFEEVEKLAFDLLPVNHDIVMRKHQERSHDRRTQRAKRAKPDSHTS